MKFDMASSTTYQLGIPIVLLNLIISVHSSAPRALENHDTSCKQNSLINRNQ